ncbi:hypothetical protein COV24_00690 [candidate division WWE3 bacterium CG10_big_fil_rev_8_21_14_0_10_32_10]|uniref:PIN domain-containing protein n=1 Tax=candidate division WWE3 bacterium CG10_big_fil_rev_8_21_14_0_10_32_10 TaxID=1975090 RepID=A0A2H0RBD5_UNCKA|nr:MAG: hypothetical protein COV24_00690 [candidate division WWE3 bacterium CG10_big_fil_rev_8_21_14_0_10_32_10]
MELKDNSKIYVDTNLFIYYFENNQKYVHKVEKLFGESLNKNIQIICSELLYLELLVLPYTKNNIRVINLYKNLEKYIPNLTLMPISKKILIESAKIRSNYSFRSPDSIHLATAFTEKCKYFYGSDKKLKSYKETHVEII